jgi:hypothetical protein
VNINSNIVHEQQSPFGIGFASRQHQTQTAFMLPDPNSASFHSVKN